MIRCGRLPATALCATLAATAVVGCGSGSGSQAPPAVHLSLTAPVDGARLNVSRVLVLGTVDPATASVRVAGNRVHVASGVFRRWISLRRGVTHIGIEAKAPGYIDTIVRVAVHSAPRRYAIPRSPDNALQDFISRGNQVCSRGVYKLQKLALAHLDQNLTSAQAGQVAHQIVAIVAPVIPQLRAIHAPAKQAGGYAKFVDDMQALLNQASSVISAASAGNVQGALSGYAGTQAALTTAENEGQALELYTCANTTHQ